VASFESSDKDAPSKPSTKHLDLGEAAVREELDAGDVTAVVGGEEDNDLSDLVGLAEPSERNDAGSIFRPQGGPDESLKAR
jgi:hypothetical protein